MTEIERQATYELVRGQLAAHISYEQADAIAQLKVLGHHETLAVGIQDLPDSDKVQQILKQIDEVAND